MNPKLIAALGLALVLSLLAGWGFYERSGRLAAEKELVTWKAAVNVRDARIQELGRAVTGLETATRAAKVEAMRLRARRAKENTALLDQIGRLGDALKRKTPDNDGCHEAIEEWRAGK